MTKTLSILTSNAGRTSSHPVTAMIAIAAVLSLWVRPVVAAESAESDIMLDGIAAVISFNANDESAAVLLLNSDVELVTRILLVSLHGAEWDRHPADNVVKFKARRLGIIVRLLAHVAAQIGEKVDTGLRDKWVEKFTEMAGGDRAVQKLLSQSGVNRRDLSYWFGNFQLCRIQLQYMADKIQMPSDAELQKMFRQGDHPLAGASWEDARKAYEAIVRNRKLQRIVGDWLRRFDQQGNIRFTTPLQ